MSSSSVVGDDFLVPQVEQPSKKNSTLPLGPAEVSVQMAETTSNSDCEQQPAPFKDQRLVRCAHTIIRVAPLFSKPTICNLCAHHIWVWQGKVRTCTRCEVYLHELCFQELVAGLARVAEGEDPSEAFTRARKELDPDFQSPASQQAPPAASVQDEAVPAPNPAQPQWFGVLGAGSTAVPPESISTGLMRFMNAARSAFGPTSTPPVSPAPNPTTPPPAAELTFTDDNSSPLSTTTGFLHTHELLSRTSYIPTLCSVCKYVLAGPCYCCKGCDYTLHLGCLAAIPTDEPYELVVVEGVKEGELVGGGMSTEYRDRSAEPPSFYDNDDPNREALLEDAKNLVKKFHQRNSTWHAALNPIKLKTMYDSHAEVYAAAMESLSRLRDSSGVLVASPEVVGDADAPGLGNSGISELELTTAYHILRYATAMYGMAYSEGYMSSIGKATVMRLFRRNYLAPKDELNNLAVMDVLALPRNDLKYSKLSNKVLEPSYGLIQDRQTKGLVLAFRGSLTDADFLSDAYGNAAEFCGGVAHEGIAHMARMAAEDASLMDEIKRIMTKRPEYKLYITGHSLGAALAMLFTIVVRHERLLDDSILTNKTHTFCFAPPPTVTVPLADEYDSHITSFVAGDDVVCRLQLNTVDRLAGQAGYSGRGAVGSVGGAAQTAPADKVRSAEDVDSLVLASQPVSLAEDNPHQSEAGDLSEELHIAGKVYFMTDPLGRTNRLVRVRRTHAMLHQIFISPSMVTSHLMDTYATGLQRLVNGLAAQRVAVVGCDDELPLSPTAAAVEQLHK